MGVYSYSQYAPHIIAALCFLGIVGIPRPTVNNPNTWHMTFLIVGLFSVFNIIINFALEPMQSQEHLAAMQKVMSAWQAKKSFLQIFAWSWSIMAILDALTAYLIFRNSQKGNGSMALVLGLFVLVNVMAVTDIIAFTQYNYDLGPFSSILAITDIAHEDYVKWILALNIVQVSLLCGGFGGWSIQNIRERFTRIVRAYSANGLVAWGRTGFASIRRNPNNKGLAQ